MIGQKVEVVHDGNGVWRLATASDKDRRTGVVEQVGKELAHIAVRQPDGQMDALIGVKLSDIPSATPPPAFKTTQKEAE